MDGGLRARKRAATRSAIERAAVSLALEHGYDRVTVEMICEASMVSQRTFFNYFGSKEGVILGPEPPLPTGEHFDRFVNSPGPDVLDDLVRAVTSALLDREPDKALLQSRRLLIGRTPELFTRQIERITQKQNDLVQHVLDRFRTQGRDVSTTPDLAEEARMVVMLVGTVMRFSMQRWFADDEPTATDELFRHSIELIHRVVTGR